VILPIPALSGMNDRSDVLGDHLPIRGGVLAWLDMTTHTPSVCVG
jgi:hypothetical protein